MSWFSRSSVKNVLQRSRDRREAVLERADPIEPGAVRVRSSIWPPSCTGSRTWIIGDQPAADVVVGEVDHVALAAGDVRRPGAGEAVGLLLLEDRRLVELAGAGLDGVAELVGQHDADGGLAELVDELGQQLGVVVDDEVAVAAVERVALDVGVRRLRRCRSRGSARSLRIGGVDARPTAAGIGCRRRAGYCSLPERFDVA